MIHNRLCSGLKVMLVVLVFSGLLEDAKGITLVEKLYINRDSMEMVTGDKLPYLVFNRSTNFEQQNAVLELAVGDTLDLWIINTDTATHGFQIKSIMGTSLSIPAGDSVHLVQEFSNEGVYIYHDPQQYPYNLYLGLGGMIYVKNHLHERFYWNMKEHASNWNTTLVNGGTVSLNNYKPDYFTINGNSHPDINADSTARIEGNVGDTLILCIANTGRGIHSIHFHGYHAEILYSSKHSHHVGRSKDTFPIYPMETLELRLVPDKPGEYPVHDHNLVAISANSIYPNGMFSTILIAP
ncbi:MAG: multicopper oxidase domain-containing protein [Aureispira sp.]|nr:multicopper oxidase domain-containing protein [Aureispira sp.]